MARLFRTFLSTAALSGVLASGGAAQFTALPVHVSPNIHPRLKTVMVAGDVGLLRENMPDFTPLAARVVFNLGRVSLTGGVGVLHHGDHDDEFTFGAAVGYDLYASSPRKPIVTLQGAVGHVHIAEVGAGEGVDRWDFPLGVALGWYLPALDINVEPWIAPRAHLRLVERGVGDETRSHFGVGSSAGLNLTHAVGPGLHFALDGLWIGNPRGGDSHVEWVLSAGVHVKIALP